MDLGDCQVVEWCLGTTPGPRQVRYSNRKQTKANYLFFFIPSQIPSAVNSHCFQTQAELKPCLSLQSTVHAVLGFHLATHGFDHSAKVTVQTTAVALRPTSMKFGAEGEQEHILTPCRGVCPPSLSRKGTNLPPAEVKATYVIPVSTTPTRQFPVPHLSGCFLYLPLYNFSSCEIYLLSHS